MDRETSRRPCKSRRSRCTYVHNNAGSVYVLREWQGGGRHWFKSGVQVFKPPPPSLMECDELLRRSGHPLSRKSAAKVWEERKGGFELHPGWVQAILIATMPTEECHAMLRPARGRNPRACSILATSAESQVSPGPTCQACNGARSLPQRRLRAFRVAKLSAEPAGGFGVNSNSLPFDNSS